MGDQLESIQWYAKPQVLVPAAALGYLLLNKKTRKQALIGGGSILVAVGAYGSTSKYDMTRGLSKLPLIAGGVLLALGYFSKSK